MIIILPITGAVIAVVMLVRMFISRPVWRDSDE